MYVNHQNTSPRLFLLPLIPLCRLHGPLQIPANPTRAILVPSSSPSTSAPPSVASLMPFSSQQ